ncbi:MAG TPA: antitoxin Xre/MbcA/ParS toxin-binding domain-containing protein [Trueperaceae bacterium]|nr:antitoxin Xre/MbcA/ParS toxin-binding domain-containing protein [Trueperaceae bacterium]
MPIAEPPTPKTASKRRKTNSHHSYALRTYDTAEKLRQRLGLDAKSMASYLGIDEKTYYRRAQTHELKGGESLKIDMLGSILEEATRVLRGEDEATHWVTTPIISLDHKRPIDHLTSINGYERVKNTLAKIEYGMY